MCLHPGTNDLDVGLAIALLDEERYAEISSRLRAEGFGPDTNDGGNNVVQRWRLGDLKVTVDFLMAPGQGRAIAERLAKHAEAHRDIVERALGFLARDFATPADIGPLRAADFISMDGLERKDNAADAHGYVNDLLRATAQLELTPAGV